MNDNHKKAEEINKIFDEYAKKIEALRREQHQILDEFFDKLEQKKIENMRNKFKDL